MYINCTTTFKDQPLSYYKWGSAGPILLFVHGFPEDGLVFEPLFSDFQQNYQCISIDLPGSGRSSYNPSLQSVEDFAESVFAVVQSEKIHKCFLFGHSMGGYISLAFAEKFPEFLLGLGLINSTAYPDSEQKKDNRRQSIQIMKKYGGLPFLKTVIPNLFSEDFKSKNIGVIEQMLLKAENFQTLALQQYYSMMLTRIDRRQILKDLAVPILFICGEKDNSFPITDIFEQVSLPSIAQVELIPEAAHMSFLEATDKVIGSIRSFIQI